MDELRFRRNDSSLGGLVSPPRNSSRLPQPLPPQDGRGGMVRRFTTDSGRVPTIASLATLRSGQESMDFGPSVSAITTFTRAVAIVVPAHNPKLYPTVYPEQYAQQDLLLTCNQYRRIIKFNL